MLFSYWCFLDYIFLDNLKSKKLNLPSKGNTAADSSGERRIIVVVIRNIVKKVVNVYAKGKIFGECLA